MRIAPMNSTKTKRAPLASFKELAQQLGVSMAHLRGRMKVADAPKPARVTETATYYNKAEFMRWWRAVA